MSNEMRKAVYAETAKRINRLLNERETGSGKAALANLRRGIGMKPGEIPELWGEIFRGMPEEMYSRSGKPTAAEWAVYIALTTFALHQQGQADAMHREQRSLGRAVGMLCAEPDDEERLLRRFRQVVTASEMTELSYYLRGLIQLLRAEGIALDYAQLASDLYDFQFSASRQRVQLRWGQDFYYQEEKKS